MRLPGIHSENIGKLLVYDGLFYSVKRTKSGRCVPLFLGEPMNRDELLREREMAFERAEKARDYCERNLRGCRKLDRRHAGDWQPKNVEWERLKSKFIDAGLYKKVWRMKAKEAHGNAPARA